MIDASGINAGNSKHSGSNLLCAGTPWFNGTASSSNPATILLPASTILISQPWVLPDASKIIGEGAGGGNSGTLVSCLIEAIKAVHRLGKNEFHLQQDLALSKTQYANFLKLRFHALIAKVEGKPGYWLITARGGQFLRGEIAVPQRVKTFRNKVLDHSREMIHILQLKGKVPEFQKEYAYEYQRPATVEVKPQPLFR